MTVPARMRANGNYSDISLEHGRRKGGRRGAKAPLEFEIFTKKVFFLSFGWEKNKFHHFWPPLQKFCKNPLVPPWEKILPTPMVSNGSIQSV